MVALSDPLVAQPPGNPKLVVLPADTVLQRVHRVGFPADAFNPRPAPTRLTGGRFDALAGDYAYTYLGDSLSIAIAETLCRDLPLDGAARLVPARLLAGRAVTPVATTRDLDVLVLHGPALAHVGAPLALTKCEADEYEVTRRWARALRAWSPAVGGFRYRPRHDEDGFAWVFFDDGPSAKEPRARGALRVCGTGLELDSEPGISLVLDVLRQHNATLG